MIHAISETIAAGRDAARDLQRNAGTAGLSALLLALGMAFFLAASVSTWRSLVAPSNAAPNANEMVVAHSVDPERGVTLASTFRGRYSYIADRQTSLACWVASRLDGVDIVSAEGERHRLHQRRVSQGWLPCWGIPVVEGRSFNAEDHERGAELVALLDDDTWREKFHRDATIVGSTVRIGTESRRVVGIAASVGRPDFGRVDIWVPGSRDDFSIQTAEGMEVEAHGRPKDGVPLDQVQAELARLEEDYRREHPDSLDSGFDGSILSHREARVPGETANLLLASMVPFFGVFLLACANASGLLLVQFVGRSRESALRMVLGATRAEVMLRFILEGAFVAVLAGLLAIASYRALVEYAITIHPAFSWVAETAYGQDDLDGTVVLFAGLVVLTGIAGIGLLPGLTATRLTVHEVLQDGSDAAGGGRRLGRVRSAVTNFLIGLSYFLVLSSVALGAGLSRAFDRPLGYEPHGLVAVHVAFPTCEEAREARAEGAASQERPEPKSVHCVPQGSFSDALRALPSVEGFGIGSGGPVYVGNHSLWYYGMADHLATPLSERPLAGWFEAESGYLEALRVELIAGRLIEETDIGTNCSVVFSRSLADRHGGWNSVVGQEVLTGPRGNRGCSVVGVIEDLNMGATSKEDPGAAAALYVSREVSQPGEKETYMVRVTGDPDQSLRAIDALIARDSQDWRPEGVQSVEEAVNSSRRNTMSVLWLFASLTGIALLFAAVGIYGVVGYNVTTRRGEYAIRKTLGATRSAIVGEVVLGQVRGSWPGLLAGAFLTLALLPIASAELAAPLAFDLHAAVVALVILGVAIVAASALPALRAARVDVARVLRDE